MTVDNDKYWQGYGEIESLIQCWLECEVVQPHWEIVCQFLKLLKIVTI